MIQELAEFGRRVTEGKNRAFNDETYSIVLAINENGEFQRLLVVENQKIQTEVIINTEKKGKARFLLDKCEEVLGVGNGDVDKKHQLFIEKLRCYSDVPSLKPVFEFYDERNKTGLEQARTEFGKIDKKSKGGNITFMVGTTLLLKTKEVRQAIIDRFEDTERRLYNGKTCSVCGSTNIPVLNESHGSVKIPKGHQNGCTLVSFNETAFESYGLKGNLNSSICRRCARNYVDGLRFLLSDGHEVKEDETQKTYYHYNHRINISDRTVVLFWTKQKTEVFDPRSMVEIPNASEIRNLFEAVWNREKAVVTTINTNMFYCCTLSSADARVIVRDWTAISLEQYMKNLSEWFWDIEMRDNENNPFYCSLRQLINATQKDKNNGEKQEAGLSLQSQLNDTTQEDEKKGRKQKADLDSKTRIGSILWNAAIKGRSYKIPLEVLQSVLTRLWKKDRFSAKRAAIIKLIINRNTNKNMKSTLDETCTSVAYLCGRLFAVIESMQWKAIGDVDCSVKDRFFAAAASQPAYVFATLLTKNVPVYQRKIGGYLAKELEKIAGRISETGTLPQRFSIIEQGDFALGYYFQRTHKKDTEASENTNL